MTSRLWCPPFNTEPDEWLLNNSVHTLYQLLVRRSVSTRGRALQLEPTNEGMSWKLIIQPSALSDKTGAKVVSLLLDQVILVPDASVVGCAYIPS
jgi:hypothetical protein